MNRAWAFSVRWVVVLCAALASTAFGQAIAPSPGFKIGDGAIHPYAQIDARYDSFVGYFNEVTPGVLSPTGDLILHFRPGVKFNLDNDNTFIGFNGSGEYLLYTGVMNPGSRALSRFQAAVSLDTAFNKQGAVEVKLGDSLVRSDRTQNPALGIGAISLYNNVYLQAPIHPGGKALEITPKVSWGVEFFQKLVTGIAPFCPDSEPQCDPARSNYSNLNFGTTAKWKFFPKTALLLDVNADWRAYFADATNNKVMFHALAGLSGLLSPKISVTLLGGYGGDFTNGSIHTFIGNAEFAYTFSPTARVAVGYARNASPVPVVGALIDDRGYLRGGVGFLSNRLTINGQFSVDYLTFLGAPATGTTTPNPTRHDVLLSFNLTPTFTVVSWFDVSLSYTLSYRASQNTAGTATVGLNYLRHEAMLRLDFHY